jgi:hypothetical protein
MPDRDNWSASMVMRWVLTGDSNAVLSMLDDYGRSLVEGGNVTRIQPLTWDDVARVPVVDASLSAEQQTRDAVLRALREIIPAREQIYAALRRGDLDSLARPNGSGDMARIGPIQWAGLRIRSIDGHDVAVPVDSEQNPLPLPLKLADYLSGAAPATSTPTVWPDPLLPAEMVMQLWPPHTIVEASSSPPMSGEVSPTDMDDPQPLTLHDSGQLARRASTARPRASDAEVKKWYEETYIPECEKARKQPPELGDWAAAQLKFGEKVRRKQIRYARHLLAPAAWRKQGCRPSSKNSAD